MSFIEAKVSIKFIIILFIGIFMGLIGSGFLNFQEGEIAYDSILLQNNSEKWMSFMSILSTLLATFFIYSGFKIENVKEELLGVKKNLEDSQEFGLQIQYAISYLMKKELEKSIDVLIVLKSEPFVLKDSNRLNTCYFFLANSYLELYKIDKDLENISKAYQFIDKAIEDINHPLKTEIYEEFEKISESI